MAKKLLGALLFPLAIAAQNITVSTNTYTPAQLVSDLIVNSQCGNISNVTYQGAVGIAYFNNNGGGFPFSEGMIIRSGNAALSGGPFNDENNSSVGSSMQDTNSIGYPSADGQDLHGVSSSN